MNLFVLSGHESFATFLNGVILQKNNAAFITAAVITTHLVIYAMVTAAVIKRTHFHAPTIQTNSFCFGEKITVFPCTMFIDKFKIYLIPITPRKCKI